MTSATVFAIKISCAGWWFKNSAQSVLNALFVPKPASRDLDLTRHCAAAIVAIEWPLTCFEKAVLNINPEMHP
jgi:hypothetical protein